MLGKTSAVQYFMLLPTTTACSISGLSVSLFSMGCGMTYLPVESLKSAFLRSVILR